MNIVQCKFCKTLFQSMGGKICPECLDRIEKDYITVRDFLFDNPQATKVEDLASGTGVSGAIIVHLMNDGRLFTKDSVLESGTCRLCGKPVSNGTVCDHCDKLVNADSANKPLRPEASAKGPVLGGKASAKMHIRKDH